MPPGDLHWRHQVATVVDIKLDRELVTDLVADLGGVSAFLDAWVVGGEDGDDKIDKTTVHRWMNGQMPKNAKRFMRLAGVLDVDPFALLTADEDKISVAAEIMLEIVQHENAMPAPLQLLRAQFGRLKQWPPRAIAADYFGRPWQTHEFSHNALERRNFYQAVELVGIAGSTRPQVYHFAFKSHGRFSSRWLQYGFVMRHRGGDVLRHIFGYSQRLEAGLNGPLRVNTWFGQGAATFKVASLHEFSLSLSPDQFSSREVLEFPA